MKTKLLLLIPMLTSLHGFAQNPYLLSAPTAGSSQYIAQMVSTKTGKTFYNVIDKSDPWSQLWGLWYTDGTRNGTQKLSLQTTQFITTEATMLTPLGDNKILFAGDNVQQYGEVWVSDGTQAGTFGLQNFVPTASVVPVLGIAAIGNKGIYMAVSTDNHLRLHATNATAYGDISVVHDFGVYANTYNTAFDFKTINNIVYFALNNAITLHTEIWRTDGTSGGTYLVKDLGLDYGITSTFMPFNNDFYFITISSTYGDYIWKSDGTEGGTAKLKHIALTFQQDNINVSYAAVEHDLITSNNALYFTANDGTHGKELWRTDGTENGTHMTFDFNPGSTGSNPNWLTVLNNQLYFSANTTLFNVGTELYGYNGQQFTSPIDIFPGTTGSNPSNITAINNTLIFSATSNVTDGQELWVSDGSSPNSFEIDNINKLNNQGSDPQLFSVQNNKAFFVDNYDINRDGLANEECVFVYNAPGKIWTGNVNTTGSEPGNWMPNGAPNSTDDVIIPVNPKNQMATDFMQVKNFFNNGSTINVNTGLIFILGDFFNEGTINNANNGVFALVTNNTNTIRSIGGTGIFNGQLTMSSGINARLTSDMKVNTLRVEGVDSIYLGDYSFTIDNFNIFTPKFITDGVGTLRLPVGGSPVLFSVMADAKSYTPLTITNTGAFDYFSVNVKNGVYSGGYSGSGTAISQEAVNKTWLVDESVAGGSNVSITAQWNAADELPMFSRNNTYLSHYINGVWDNGTIGTAGGTGPYTFTRAGITGFSPFAVTSSPTILPLYLFNFAATNNNNNVLLKWQTQNEINTALFNVQRSIDGFHFNTITSLKAAGNSTAINNYSYNDNDVAKLNVQKIYYQIQTVDKDSKINVSKIISVELTTVQNKMMIWPNPVKDVLNINVTGYSGDAVITIYDMTGRQLLSRKQNIVSGTFNINATAFAPGTYILQINENGKTIQQSFIKQ
jgi:ELWxxDGT repeat protein